MKSSNKSKVILIGVLIILIGIITFVISDKKLDIKSEEITTLYKYLGEADIYHCGGLNVYSSDTATKANISTDNALCMAYYNVNTQKIKSDTAEVSGKNKSDIKICKVGENTTLAADDEENCPYTKISKADLNESYKTIYGEEIKEKDYEKFYISSYDACFLEGEEYICGNAETFNYSLAPEATIYRLINKAVRQFNGDIIIFDYFLKVSGDKCYTSNNGQEENTACSEALKGNVINEDFIKKYATTFKHTFKRPSKNETPFWAKSQIKK